MKLKKVLSIVLCVAMVLSTMSFNVFAADENTYVAKIGDVSYQSFAEALAATEGMSGDVEIELLADAEFSYGAREAYGSDDTTSITINGNNKTLTLKQTDSDWSSIGMKKSDGVLKMNDVTVEKTGYGDTNGAWNTHTIIFKCNVEMNNVIVNNAISVQNGATLNKVTINEANGYYGLWITGNGQTVTVNGGAINATNGGRGIKIADEYVDAPAKVQLTVEGMTFNTAKKAAVLVSSTAGADITTNNCDITNVTEDSTNFVWVDEDWTSSVDKVTVEGGSVFVESAIVIKTVDDLKTFRDEVNNGNKYEGKYVVLANDIDLSGENWTPIGDDTKYFWGIFDGGNHTISNMTININTPDRNVFAGLFGGVRKATIKDLTIRNASIDVVGAKVRAAAVVAIAHSNSENHTTANLNFENITVDGCTINADAKSNSVAVGGFSGYCYPANMKNISVSNLTLNPKASGSTFVGGLVGYMQGQNISNNGNTRAYYTVDTFSVNNITINSKTNDTLAGGFAGYTYYGYITLKNSTINGFKVNVDVTKEALVGGLIGLAHRSDRGHTFTNVKITDIDFDIVSDSGVDVLVGGMVGYSGSPIEYSDCSVSGTITETCTNSAGTSSAFVGGFVGGTVSWAQSYTNCSADVDVNASNIAGGFVGYNGVTATYTNCEASGTVSGISAAGFAANAENSTIINCEYTGESDVPFVLGAAAKIGDRYYKTLDAAIDNANGATVTLIADTTEGITIADGATVVIDLNGNTLNGYIAPCKPASLTVKNGSIVNTLFAYSGIEINSGVLTLENVNIDSARHAVRIDGDVTADVKGGTYKTSVVIEGKTQHAFNISGDADVTFTDGTFIGPKGTAADSGAAVNAKAGSTVIINGGNFSGGKNNTLSGEGNFVVNNGAFDQDVSAYLADGKEVVKVGDDAGYACPYIIADTKAASAINVKLERVSDGLYDIILVSSDGNPIHEFVAAEFTFKNESKTVGGGTMQYEVLGLTEGDEVKTVVEQASKDEFNNEQYTIHVPDGANRLNSEHGFIGETKFVNMLKIGQVKFIGQGKINFSIAKGEVDTTWQNTNLGRYYTVADGTLGLADAEIENGSVADITRNVAIKVTYNHELEAAWTNNKITATLKDAYGEIVGTDDISDGEAKFDNVKIGRITVTLEAPGFRKFVYETTLDEDDDDTVVLSFWNDVKKKDYKLSIEKGATAVTHNFVVGDIVMDYIVDKYDLAAVTSYYGMYNIKNNAKYIKYDLNRDGDIDIRDVQYVLHTMGK